MYLTYKANSGLNTDNKPTPSIKIYPNPNKGIINIETDLQTFSKVTFISVTGKPIVAIGNLYCTSKTLDINITELGLKPGIYYLKIKNEGEFRISKFILINP